MVLQSVLTEREEAEAKYNLPLLRERIEDEAAGESPRVAIAVASGEARRALTEALTALNAQVVVHESLRTLRHCLLREKVDLVIVDATLPDANWADVLRLIVRASLSTDLLVHSRTADEGLRSEVMWRGACGIVVPPYSFENVRGVAGRVLPRPRRAVEKAPALVARKGPGTDDARGRDGSPTERPLGAATSRAEYFTRRDVEVAGEPVHLMSYKVGESWLCKVDSISPGAELASSVSCSQSDAELLALSKAEKRLVAAR